MDAKGRIVVVGVAQIVSGVINVVGMSALSAFVWGLTTMIGCAILSLGTCPWPIGVVMAFFPIAVGLVEIVVGILVLMRLPAARVLGLLTGVLEIVSILYGGVVSLAVGVLVVLWLGDDDVGRVFARGRAFKPRPKRRELG